MKKPILLTFALSLFAFMSMAQKGDYSFKESFSVSSSPNITLRNSDGDIKVYASNKNQVEVYFIARRNGRFLRMSKADLEKEDFTFEINNSSGNLDIRIRERRNNYMNYRNQINISMEVYAPKKSSCDVHSSDGDIVLKGLKADQTIRTSDGDIDLVDIQGDIRGRTSDGNINFRNVSGSLDVSTSDGNVKGNLLALTNSLKVKTSDGNIRVSIPRSLGLDLDIRGESLRIPLKNFNGRSTDHKINGKMNGGGKLVQLRTSDGRITLDM
ncbi:hypothetical protein BKI52_34875 [marine bacterium AO1-C]|nr:hypothetical protein BKI52_34875 [marine bacterium AO1-C]